MNWEALLKSSSIFILFYDEKIMGAFKSKDDAAKRIMESESHYGEWQDRLENPEDWDAITLDEMLKYHDYLKRHYSYKEVELE